LKAAESEPYTSFSTPPLPERPTFISQGVIAEGYDVFIVTDASGGVTLEAHDMAVRRMVAAGAVPTTWLAVLGEWQRDWAREKTAAGVAAPRFARASARSGPVVASATKE